MDGDGNVGLSSSFASLNSGLEPAPRTSDAERVEQELMAAWNQQITLRPPPPATPSGQQGGKPAKSNLFAMSDWLALRRD